MNNNQNVIFHQSGNFLKIRLVLLGVSLRDLCIIPAQFMKRTEQHLFQPESYQKTGYYFHLGLKNALFSAFPKPHWNYVKVSLKNSQFNKICHSANHPYLCKGLSEYVY